MTEEEREDLLEGLKAKWEQVRDPVRESIEGKVGADDTLPETNSFAPWK